MRATKVEIVARIFQEKRVMLLLLGISQCKLFENSIFFAFDFLLLADLLCYSC